MRPCRRRTCTSPTTRAAGLEVFAAPGHASHHVCYFDGTTLYAGDAAGVRILPSRAVLPPTPPPDVDVEAWYRTLEQIERRAPERLALIHFGLVDDVGRHLAELRGRLDALVERVEEGATETDFVAAARAELPAEEADAYDRAMPFWQSYAGLRRYWDTAGVMQGAAPLREREFRLLFAGRTVSLVGSAIAPVALAFAVLDLTGSKTDLGLVLAAAQVPLVLFLLVGGIWADRLPRNKVMMSANLVSALAQAVPPRS